MKATQKLAELTDLAPVQNPEEVKGGFFFLSYLFGHKAPAYQAPAHQAPAYQAPAPAYQAPKNEGKGHGKKGY